MRWLVVFRSHHEGPADVHFVDVGGASSALEAMRRAQRESPPLHGWVVAHAVPWPRGCRSIGRAALAFTGS